MKGKEKRVRTQIVTQIDPELKMELFKSLIDEGISFREWVERNAKAFLKKRGVI